MSHRSAVLKDASAARVSALVAALREAQRAAAETDCEDGGSCCLDFVAVLLPKAWKREEREAACARAGISLGEPMKRFGVAGYRSVDLRLPGMACRRTQAARNAAAAFNAAFGEHVATVIYLAD